MRRGAQKRVGRGAVTPKGIYAIRMASRAKTSEWLIRAKTFAYASFAYSIANIYPCSVMYFFCFLNATS